MQSVPYCGKYYCPILNSFLSLWATITITPQVYFFLSLWATITITPLLLQSPEGFTLLTGTVSGRIKQLLGAVCMEYRTAFSVGPSIYVA